MAFEQQGSLATKSIELRQKLNALLEARDSNAAIQSEQIIFDRLTSSELTLLNADVIVTANEVNQRHGTGVLINKIFGNCANIFSIRAHNHYDAEHDFGDLSAVISVQELSRKNVFSNVLQAFAQCTPRQVICIPFDPDEILIAIAIKELFDVPLCMYIMDDNNIYAKGIPDPLMQEALTKSSLRLAISPELQQAYQHKYDLKFWLLPPVVTGELIHTDIDTVPKPRNPKTGIIVGNIWGQRWLDLLRQTVKGSGITIHWYCNAASKSRWLQFDPTELAQDGIFFRDPLPEPELAEKLKEYAFAVLPSGVFDSTETENNQAVAKLSLPTKVPFITATSNTPILVLGSRESAAARFVERFNLGIICDYHPNSFQQTIEQITRSEMQTLLRQNAQTIAPSFSDAGIAQWIFQSLQRGEPIDHRFEQFISPLESTEY